MGKTLVATVIVIVGFVVALILGVNQAELTKQFGAAPLGALELLLFIAFAIVFIYAAAPRLSDIRLQMRRRVFLINSLLLLFLFALAVFHYQFPVDEQAPWLKASLHAIWFAMLGSVAISFRGVYEHPQASEWNEGWWLWYMGRPFTGAIVGSMVFLVLQVANPKDPPLIPSLAVASFIFGTQESRFFGFLYQVGKLILTTASDLPAGLKVTLVTPSTGAAGDSILLSGTGMKPRAAAYLGANQLTNVVVSPDGSSLAGLVPNGAGAVDVVVSNPDGTSYRLPQAFTYS